jgi:hypothetical protein
MTIREQILECDLVPSEDTTQDILDILLVLQEQIETLEKQVRRLTTNAKLV